MWLVSMNPSANSIGMCSLPTTQLTTATTPCNNHAPHAANIARWTAILIATSAYMCIDREDALDRRRVNLKGAFGGLWLLQSPDRGPCVCQLNPKRRWRYRQHNSPRSKPLCPARPWPSHSRRILARRRSMSPFSDAETVPHDSG